MTNIAIGVGTVVNANKCGNLEKESDFHMLPLPNPSAHIFRPQSDYKALGRDCSTPDLKEQSKCLFRILDKALCQKNIDVPFITHVIQSIPDAEIQSKAFQMAKSEIGADRLESNRHSMR